MIDSNKKGVIVYRMDRVHHKIDFFEDEENNRIGIQAMKPDEQPCLLCFRPIGQRENDGNGSTIHDHDLQPLSDSLKEDKVESYEKKKKDDGHNVHGRKTGKMFSDGHIKILSTNIEIQKRELLIRY